MQGRQKAVAALVVSFIGAVITWALATFPDNNDVQQWGATIAGILTVLATTGAVFQTKNVPYSSGTSTTQQVPPV